MNSGKTVFAQLMDHVSAFDFNTCVERHAGHHKVKSFTCWDQYLCMTFAQLTGRESLRDIEVTLRATPSRLYHMGIRGRVSRNTLANANQVRDWRIYADLAQRLIVIARRLYAGEEALIRFDRAVYALDSTTIDLCLAVFPWAEFRRHKAAIKLHTLFDVGAGVPTVILITPGKVHDVNMLDALSFEPGAIYIADRGYLDFERLHRIHLASAFFITRPKSNLDFARREHRPVDKSTGLRADQSITLRGIRVRHDYPERLRRVGYVDPETGKRLVFLSNNFSLPALTIAHLYKRRWQVELFFKWIKQHLRVKTFYGTSDNAVKTQIWIAISVYVLIAILKRRLGLSQNPYTILQVLSVSLFEKTPISDLFSDTAVQLDHPASCRQLDLFN